MSENLFLSDMGKRIAGRRKSLGLSQEALAEKIGVSTQMISNPELGKKVPRPESLAKLCKVLDISTDVILTGSGKSFELDDLVKIKRIPALSDDKRKIIYSIADYMSLKKS